MKSAIVICSVLVLSSPAPIRSAEPSAGLDRLDFMVGTWRGTSKGESGEGQIDRQCARILNRRYLECSTTVTYPPQKANPKGEVHVDRAIYSFDKKTKKLRLRQFHGEGFVNSYTAGDALVFETDDIENIPDGWRARESHKLLTPDSWQETFELAPAGNELAPYSASTLERVKS